MKESNQQAGDLVTFFQIRNKFGVIRDGWVGFHRCFDSPR